MQKYNLNARQKLILTYMNGKHGVVPGKELAERLGVSTRTVRLAVSEINDYLKDAGISIESVSGKGYRLVVGNRELFHEIISDREILHTKEDRIVYLIMRFVSSDDWVNLSELEDDMFVSRTTLENDIREIRNRICDHEPRIMMKRKNNAVLFEDDEMKKRDILLHIYSESWDFDSREGISFRNGLADREIMEEIRLVLVAELKRSGIELDDYGMVNMKIAISLIYSRNIEGHRLYNAGVNKRYGTCRRTVDRILETLRRSWDLEIEESDYIWLTGYLERLRVLGMNQTDYEIACRAAGEECIRTAERLIAELEDEFGIVFQDDEIFRTQLLMSVRAFYNQQMSTQAQSRFSTDLLEKNYTLLGDAARYLAVRLEELSGKRMRSPEANWLLPVLASATERQERKNRRRIRVVVVSHLNDGLTRYMCDNLEKLFGTRFEIVAAMPVHNRRAALELSPSLVITTVRMQLFDEHGIPCIVTSPIITQEELIEIDRILQKVERAALHEPLPMPISVYLKRGGGPEADSEVAASADLKRGRVLKADPKMSPEELLRYVTCCWREWGLIDNDAEFSPDSFRYAPLRGEAILGYQTGELAAETFFTEIEFESAVVFDRFRNVRKVFLGYICREDRRYMPAFYGELDFMNTSFKNVTF